MKRFLFLGLSATTAFSEGVYLHEKSPLLAPTNDHPSLVFYNVAGGVFLKTQESKIQTSLSNTSYFVKAYLTNDGSKDRNGSARLGLSQGKSFVVSKVPDIFFNYAFKENLSLGFSLTCPYGLGVKYEPAWFGRYEMLKAQLETTDFTPYISYKVTPTFSIGAGVTVRHVYSEFEKAIDFGSLGGGTAQQDDGAVKAKMRGNSFALNAGIYWKNERSFLGVSWQQSDKVKQKGPVTFTLSRSGRNVLGVTGAFKDTRVHTSYKLPAKILLHGGYSLTNSWRLLADTLFMTWSTIKTQDLVFENSSQSTEVINHYYRNTWHFNVVSEVTVTEKIRAWFGVGFSQTPVKTQYRRPELPDSNRKSLWMGAQYSVTKNCYAAITAVYFHYNNATIDLAATTATGRLQARAKANVMAVKASLSLKI